MIEGLVARIKAEYGGPMKVVATGGLAPLFAEGTMVIEQIEPDLTLDGLRLLAERNPAPTLRAQTRATARRSDRTPAALTRTEANAMDADERRPGLPAAGRDGRDRHEPEPLPLRRQMARGRLRHRLRRRRSIPEVDVMMPDPGFIADRRDQLVGPGASPTRMRTISARSPGCGRNCAARSTPRRSPPRCCAASSPRCSCSTR